MEEDRRSAKGKGSGVHPPRSKCSCWCIEVAEEIQERVHYFL